MTLYGVSILIDNVCLSSSLPDRGFCFCSFQEDMDLLARFAPYFSGRVNNPLRFLQMPHSLVHDFQWQEQYAAKLGSICCFLPRSQENKPWRAPTCLVAQLLLLKHKGSLLCIIYNNLVPVCRGGFVP